ncbi:hypothetical protein ZWY2020_001238 [Hordeum vulgare]|nr:hypothetical protein ZWY2020_001238 [Hordeum vulgare]
MAAMVAADLAAPDAEEAADVQAHAAEPEEEVRLQMPMVTPILIPKRSWTVAFDCSGPELAPTAPECTPFSSAEVIPVNPSSFAKESFSFQSPAVTKKGAHKKDTPVVDSSVRRCTRGSIKRDGLKPLLQELPAHVPKKRKPKAKPMSPAHESADPEE